MSTKSFLVSSAELVAVGRFTFTPLRFTMLRLTSIKRREQEEHDVDQGNDLNPRLGVFSGKF